jgi:signal transduction histidine kinase
MSQYYEDMSKDEVKDSVSNIFSSSQKVYNLILNLLEWSRLQTGRLEVDKNILNLKKSSEEIVNLYKENTGNKKITIKNEVPEELIIFADEYMVNTVLRNLISNSIKFTNPGGSITINAVRTGEMAEIIIQDNGIGISEENQKKIFRIDEQFRRNGTSHEKGTGLGLILCKEFVEKNGGTIYLESKENEGSKFIFTMPLHNE